jgi:hypothetical protein
MRRGQGAGMPFALEYFTVAAAAIVVIWLSFG